MSRVPGKTVNMQEALVGVKEVRVSLYLYYSVLVNKNILQIF